MSTENSDGSWWFSPIYRFFHFIIDKLTDVYYALRTSLKRALYPKPKERFETVKGRQICYLRVGSGPHNMLCIPGFLGRWNHFHRQLAGLNSAKFTIISVDPPGYGKSVPLDRDTKSQPDVFHEDAEVLNALMEQLGLVPYSILGWSDGANTALIQAHQQRDSNNVNRLVLLSGNAYFCETIPQVAKYTLDVNTWPDDILSRLKLWTTIEYVQKINDGFCDCSQRMCTERIPIVSEDEMKEIKQETLVIHGEKDDHIPVDHAYHIQQSLPNCRGLFIHPTAGHNVNISHYEWFNRIVERFLTTGNA